MAAAVVDSTGTVLRHCRAEPGPANLVKVHRRMDASAACAAAAAVAFVVGAESARVRTIDLAIAGDNVAERGDCT
jgi:hypothetical protein